MTGGCRGYSEVPGNQLLLSPSATIQFQVKVQVPHNYCRTANICPVDARQNVSVAGGNLYNGVGAANGQQTAQGPAISFGEGNSVLSCAESISYTVNGGSISHSNWHLFKRTLDSCFIPARVAQRCFSQCGGSFNRYDSTGCSSEQAFGMGGTGATHANRTNGVPSIAGMTMDSGLQMRLRNFSDNVIAYTPLGVLGADGVELTVRIQAPLDGGVFNQVYAESGLARSSPYQKLCLAIPNYNQGSITILYKDLLKCLVRRLGRTYTGGGSTVALGGYPAANPFKVTYDTDYTAELHLTWLRMQSFRRYPDAISLATYRTQTYIEDMPAVSDVVVLAATYSDPELANQKYLLPSGPDRYAHENQFSIGQLIGSEARRWECQFQNLQFSQPPSYLIFTAQKSSSCFRHSEPPINLNLSLAGANPASALGNGNAAVSAASTAGVAAFVRSIAQNQDSNLAIVRFKCLVQSSVGSFEFSSDSKFPYVQDTRELFSVHKRNCCQAYLEDSGMKDWQDRCCALVLSSSEYMQGLGSSVRNGFPDPDHGGFGFSEQMCLRGWH